MGMLSGGMHGPAAHTQQWRGESGALAFGSAWRSPQRDMQPPQRIASHAPTGCVVVADARLDNMAELRAWLAVPAPNNAPDSTTDHAAALILQAWLRWGEDCVDRIDGDFAFAIHDPRQQLLYLARDRMGERPLYVHHIPGRLVVFGSTSHAVMQYPEVPRDLNEMRIADYLLEAAGGGMEGADFTSTFHLAVQRHPPRHVMRVSPDGHQLRQYWHIAPGRAGPLPRTDAAWAEALAEAMERAVAQRLAGPQRIGSMLSGGLDSTSLAIIAGEQLRAAGMGPLPTFSATHTGLAGCKETEAVGHLVDMPIFQPNLLDIANLGNQREELEQFLDAFDEPFDIHMAMLDGQYAAAARLGVDAVIDGGNGDSLFLPGGVMRRQLRSGRWWPAWRNAQGLARFGGQPRQYLYTPLRSALTPAWLRTAMQPQRDRQQLTALLNASLISPALAARINLQERLQRLKSLRSPHPLDDPVPEAVEVLQHTFPAVGAERYHRVAARHGVTPLAPFSERRLLELAVNLPDRQRLRDGWTKPVLREAMRARMPEPVRLRTDKQHLGGRLTQALWENRGEQLAERLHAGRKLVAPYVDLSRLDTLASQATLGANNGSVTAQMVSVAQLGHWLARW